MLLALVTCPNHPLPSILLEHYKGAKTNLSADYVFAVRGAGSLAAMVFNFCDGPADINTLSAQVLKLRTTFSRSVVVVIVDIEDSSRNLFMSLQGK
jgi:hypothetical protein